MSRAEDPLRILLADAQAYKVLLHELAATLDKAEEEFTRAALTAVFTGEEARIQAIKRYGYRQGLDDFRQRLVKLNDA